MYDGWLRFGGVEVINADRTAAYVLAGCSPDGIDVDVPDACQGLGEALGDAPYTMPAIDAAPWFEPEDPATHWFGGVIPLEVTGLDGTTRTAGTAERLGDGGIATLARRGVRTVQVSALLTGRDAAAVHAGLEWLTAVLHRECEQDEDCEGTTLEAFTACPAPLGAMEDLDSPLISHPQSAAGAWLTSGGVWEATSATFRVSEPGSRGSEVFDGGGPATAFSDTLDGGTPYSAADPDVLLVGGDPDDVPADATDGGDPSSTYDPSDPTSDGGEPATVFLTVADGGGVRSFGVSARLAAPNLFGCLSEVEARWTITPLAGSAVIRLGAVDRFGRELTRGDEQTIDGTTTVTRRFLSPRWDEWRPALWVDEPGAVVALDVQHRPDLTPDACLAPYRRFYSNVTTLAGPTPVARHDSDDGGHVLQVEWTWQAGDPYRYGDPRVVVAGLPGTTNGAADQQDPGAVPNFIGAKTVAATACTRPTSSALLCAPDPTYPAFVAPPAAPTVADTSAPAPSGYVRSMLQLTTSVVRATAGAATFIFANDATRKRGIRVRIWANEGSFSDVVECAFEQEFYINHLAPDAVLTVDAVHGRVTSLCPPSAGGATEDARPVMRGSYGGAFRYPILRCDKRYYIAVDTPSASGALDWSLLLSPREG